MHASREGKGFQGEAWTVQKPNGQTALDLVCVSMSSLNSQLYTLNIESRVTERQELLVDESRLEETEQFFCGGESVDRQCFFFLKMRHM